MKKLPKLLLNYLERAFHFTSFRGHSFWEIPINSNSVVVDLGANRCDFSSEVKKKFQCSVFPVEPNIALLPNDAELLNSVDRIAITESEGEFEFTISDNPEASSLYSDIADVFGTATVIKVKGMSLNQYIVEKEIKSNIALLKVDIEGGEIDMLSKIKPEELDRIEQMTVEFHSFLNPALETSVISIINKLRQSGFWVINCNYPYYDDVLFINKKLLQKHRWQWLDILMMKFIYIARGITHNLIGTHANQK